MAPLAPHEKVLVSQDFFATAHAEKTCEQCHGGDPAASKRTEAHRGLVRDPSEVPPFGKGGRNVCAGCHEEEFKTASTSLHTTFSTYPKVLRARAGNDPANWGAVIEPGSRNHCNACHASCGQCHVSRPNSSGGGFVRGHVFQGKPDMVNQCTACHGSRVGDEYYGLRGVGDEHFAKKSMQCAACHTGAELHASGDGLTSRYELHEMPRCVNCHEKDLGKVAQHKVHLGKVQCQVCHAQDYANCYSCHTGKDESGLAYFVNQMEHETFKIGLNYPGTGLSEEYILVRHVPVDQHLFDFYGKDALKTFGNVPTWKRTSPHNIQRTTWRSASCNNCHGQRKLFLSESDLLEYEKDANRRVVVPDGKVPERRDWDEPVVAGVAVQGGLSITAEALHEALGKKEPLVLVDARPLVSFEAGHIAGAVSLDAATDLRNAVDATPRSMTLKAPAELAKLLGSRGIDRSTRVVVYGTGTLEAPLLAHALNRLGHTSVAVLDGGLDAWTKEAGLPLAKGAPPSVPSRAFEPKPNDGLLVNNGQVAAAIDGKSAVVIDVRSAAQFQSLLPHPLQTRSGHIEGSVNLPVTGLWTVEGFLREPLAAAWLLESRGVTKDKRIIVTCTSGQAAAGAWWALKVLGYPDVAVHDGSWISWERSPQMKGK